MTRQEKNTATGAVIGGVVGNVMCGGVLCTGAGAAVGGAIGHEAGKYQFASNHTPYTLRNYPPC
jgi:osmotically inducible lipoprotein OsmB